MTFPSFVSGEVLRATDMNAVGLWRVGGGTISGANTDFIGCFTSDYTDYRIVIDQPTNTAAGEFYIRYLSGTNTVTTASNYYWAYRGLTSGGGGSDQNANANANGFLGWETPGTGGKGGITMDIYAPNVATQTTANIQTNFLGSGVYVSRNGMLAWDATTVFTGIRITSAGGSSLGGNCSIYAYRKA
jgi:hypothetical protein